MRVLFLCSTLAVGGAERQLALLVPVLGERDIEPTVATLRHEGRYFDVLAAGGVRTVSIGVRSRADVAGLARAYRLWRLRPDVVFTSSVDAQVVGQAVAARARARHVTAEHGGIGIPRAPHRRLLTRAVAPLVDGVVAVSPTQVPELVALGYRRQRITVVPNGIPAPVPRRARAEVRAALGLSEADVVALFAATLRPEKRAERFVEAVRRAANTAPSLRAVVAGGGPELERVRALASAAAGDRVLVLGERSDVAELMAAADVLCVTSSVEGLPLSLLEAMALGLPVLSTRVGGVPDAVEDGRSGWLVEPDDLQAFADALGRVATMPDRERRAVGAAGRDVYLARFTLERMVDAYERLLRASVG